MKTWLVLRGSYGTSLQNHCSRALGDVKVPLAEGPCFGAAGKGGQEERAASCVWKGKDSSLVLGCPMATGGGEEMSFFQPLSLMPGSNSQLEIEQSGICHSQTDGGLNPRHNCD